MQLALSDHVNVSVMGKPGKLSTISTNDRLIERAVLLQEKQSWHQYSVGVGIGSELKKNRFVHP